MVAPAVATALRTAVARIAKFGLKKAPKAKAPKKKKKRRRDDTPDEEKDIDEAIKEALEEMSYRMEEEAVRLCPVRSGALRGSITSGVEEDTNTVWVGAGFDEEVNYAKYVEYGTPPHIIVPNTKQALYWKGAEYPVRRVMHPGTRPNPFLRPAATKYEQNFQQYSLRS